MGSVEADGLKALMDANHQQNRGDIEALKNGQLTLAVQVSSLATQMASLAGSIDGAVKVMKLLGWIVLAVIAALGLWFTSLEVRGKIAQIKPAVYSQQVPQDAQIPLMTR